jgi:hypothetical protein
LNRERQEVPVNNDRYEYKSFSFSKKMDKGYRRLYRSIGRFLLFIPAWDISGMDSGSHRYVSRTFPLYIPHSLLPRVVGYRYRNPKFSTLLRKKS